MICYHGATFCADQEKCAVADEDCGRRFTRADMTRALEIGLPVAWAPMAKDCKKYISTTEHV